MQFDWTVKLTDVAIIFATLLGPILAVQAQKWVDRRKDQNKRRTAIFHTLMATRANALSQSHVDALNAVPIEFYGERGQLKEVTDAWKEYLHHLGKAGLPPEIWSAKRQELYVNLLHKMAIVLDYAFNRVEIETGIYAPQAHAAMANDQEVIRRGLADLFAGKYSLPLNVTSFATDPGALKEQEELRRLFIKLLNGEIKVPVQVINNENSGQEA